MQKFLNDPLDFVDEALEGILRAHPADLRRVSARGLIRADAPLPRKVGLVTGGGFGHLPLFLGYVGDGLADGVAVGNVFASPGAIDIAAVGRAVSAGHGVLFLIGNYFGDVANFRKAAELLAAEGIPADVVTVTDDVASAPPDARERRRGIAGAFFVYKIAGAAAAAGLSLEEVGRLARRANAATHTIGVALSPCEIPGTGRPSFTLPAGEMEIGMGIHGEAGIERGPLRPAREVAALLVERLAADGALDAPEVAVLLNSLGATSPEELYVLYGAVHEALASHGTRVAYALVGRYATSMEMAGCSLSVLRLEEAFRPLLERPAYSPLLQAIRLRPLPAAGSGGGGA
ncbi:MAG: dihydroxyacetone kinase subunit DhaK [Actinomycetia bacterium]|nr:dihydroxyacetone kinase subunit DhaK [Actinomycetes bacterium]